MAEPLALIRRERQTCISMKTPRDCRLPDRAKMWTRGMIHHPTGGTTMKSLVDHLSQYAAYHRDPRNIASHFIGIPLIVVAVAVLLSRPEWPLAGVWVSPAVLLALASAWFYLRLELRLGRADDRVAGPLRLAGSCARAAKHAGLAGERHRDVCGGLGDSVCRSSLRRTQTGVCR